MVFIFSLAQLDRSRSASMLPNYNIFFDFDGEVRYLNLIDYLPIPMIVVTTMVTMVSKVLNCILG